MARSFYFSSVVYVSFSYISCDLPLFLLQEPRAVVLGKKRVIAKRTLMSRFDPN